MVVEEIEGLQDIEDPPSDIPTFDGAEFSGEKSDETLIKIMDMLNIPPENRAQILKEEKEFDKKVREKMKSLCNSKQDGPSLTSLIHVNISYLSVEEETLHKNFS